MLQVRGEGRRRSTPRGRRWPGWTSTSWGSNRSTGSCSRRLIKKFNGGPVGLDTIATSLSEERETIEDVHEPYLIQIRIPGPNLRAAWATELAYRHMGVTPPRPRTPANAPTVEATCRMPAACLLVFGVLLALIGGALMLFGGFTCQAI